MRTYPRGTYPTFARETLAARAALTTADEVGLALRAHRHALGLAQRSYARLRGWSKTYLARLETQAGGVRLDDVVAALDGTGYALGLYRRDGFDPVEAAATLPVPEAAVPHGGGRLTTDGATGWSAVEPEDWPRTELVARVRDGSRRFPAHRSTRQVTSPPPWWWASEATSLGVEPHWYCPGPSVWDPPLEDTG